MDHISPDAVSRRNWMGITALQYAASRGNTTALETLLNVKADPNSSDIVGESLLLAAVTNFHDEAVRILLREGAKITQLDHTGVTLLQRVNETSPLWSKFQNIIEWRDWVLPAESKRLLSLCTIQDMFSTLERWPTLTKDIVRTFSILLGYQIMSLHPWFEDSDSEARILFEGSMTKLVDRSVRMYFICVNCEADRSYGPVHICQSCWQRALCDNCYQERAKGEVVRGCMSDHEYLTCADEE